MESLSMEFLLESLLAWGVCLFIIGTLVTIAGAMALCSTEAKRYKKSSWKYCTAGTLTMAAFCVYCSMAHSSANALWPILMFAFSVALYILAIADLIGGMELGDYAE